MELPPTGKESEQIARIADSEHGRKLIKKFRKILFVRSTGKKNGSVCKKHARRSYQATVRKNEAIMTSLEKGTVIKLKK